MYIDRYIDISREREKDTDRHRYRYPIGFVSLEDPD